MKITELTHSDPDFYPTLGPYLANRDVHQFVGDTIWDDPNKTWLTATGRNGALTGFCGVTFHARRTLAESLYLTNPEDHATATALVAHAVKHYGHDRHLHATVRHQHTYAYTHNDFAAVGETKNFTKLLRAATITKDADHAR